jgi:hypothetical protein
VELEFNELAGEWWKYYDHASNTAAAYLDYEDSPLTISAGKPQIVTELIGKDFGRTLFIGDGMSDLHTRSVVDLFVGFGGVVRREKVERGSEVYVTAKTLAPILPMAVGESGLTALQGTPHEALMNRGIALCQQADQVAFYNPTLATAFNATFVSTPAGD